MDCVGVRTCDREDDVVRIMCLFRVIIAVTMVAIPSMSSAQIQLSPVATGLRVRSSSEEQVMDPVGSSSSNKVESSKFFFREIHRRYSSTFGHECCPVESVACSVLRSIRFTARTAGFSFSTRRILMVRSSWPSISRLLRHRMSRERLNAGSW